MTRYAYREVDVFSAAPLRGNPVAVVHGAAGLDAARMQAFARWTNLSGSTFVLAPTQAEADYALRIFTPARELPFAGHPTLGSCHAWLEAGGRPQGAEIVQQCAIGLVRIRRDGTRLAFAAPPLKRSGPVDAATLGRIAAALRIDADAIRASNWVDNGPGWVAVMLGSRDELLALQPDLAAFGELEIGVVAPWPGGEADFEVRAFVPTLGVGEDPVTGSLNAGLAQWLVGAGLAPKRYVASQGTALGRAGRVFVEQRGADLWIGGECVTVVDGGVVL